MYQVCILLSDAAITTLSTCTCIDTSSSNCKVYATSLAAVAGVSAVSIVYSIVITLAVIILYVNKRRKEIR